MAEGEVGRIRDQLRRAVEGGAWHGPALREIIGDMSAEEAAQRPVAAAHSAWEIVAHVSAWLEIVARRLRGEAVEPTDAEDWPAGGGGGGGEAGGEAAGEAGGETGGEPGGETGWARTREAVDTAHRALQAALDDLTEEDLERQVPGQRYSNYVMLHGAVQHTLYHAGQLALLRKAVRTGR